MNVPTASVLIPTLNEEAAIAECLGRILAQTTTDLEVIVADGGSTDGTRKIVEDAAAADERVQLIDNPRRLQSAALNEALAEARSSIVVRVDARSFVEPDYVERCCEVIRSTGAAVVGGRMVPRPEASTMAQGIAIANGAWWGAGPARFHADATDAAAGPVDTVYLGAFDVYWLHLVGGWAEDVGVNEDYELNHRIRVAGGVVWFDPGLAVRYQPRSTLRALARQYFRYGRSKAAVMRRHPGSIRLRQAAPSALIAAGALALGPGRTGRRGRLAVAAHGALLVMLSSRGPGSVWIRSAAAAAAWTMHWCWAAGVWFGAIRPFPPAVAERS